MSGSNLLLEVRSLENLWVAWRHVAQLARTSKSPFTRESSDRFEIRAPLNLKKLQSVLKTGFQYHGPYQPLGKAIKKSGSSKKRPILVFTPEVRILHRAVLQVLERLPAVTSLIENDYSFGGIRKRGVEQAVNKVKKLANEGFTHFISFDIKEYYKNVDRQAAINLLSNAVGNDELIELVNQLTYGELSNYEELLDNGEYDLFPSKSLGIQQGSSLSTLLGNVYLHNFDTQMNEDSDTITLRYIDDVLILAKSHKSGWRTCKRAFRHLKKLGLRTYSPQNAQDRIDKKANDGVTRSGFEYLGCRLDQNNIEPSQANCERIASKIRKRAKIARHALHERRVDDLPDRDTVIMCLYDISNSIRSWSKQYSFCTNRRRFIWLDSIVESEVNEILSQLSKLENSKIATALGIFKAASALKP